MSLLIGKAIYSILSGNTTIQEKVQNKIYPIYAPDETVVPFIVYERSSVNTYYTKDGHIYDEDSIYVNIVSDDYSENIEISDAVRNALEFIEGKEYVGIHIYSSLMSNASETFGIDGFITQLQFTVKCK